VSAGRTGHDKVVFSGLISLRSGTSPFRSRVRSEQLRSISAIESTHLKLFN
jgi:hypothetical protein